MQPVGHVRGRHELAAIDEVQRAVATAPLLAYGALDLSARVVGSDGGGASAASAATAGAIAGRCGSSGFRTGVGACCRPDETAMMACRAATRVSNIMCRMSDRGAARAQEEGLVTVPRRYCYRSYSTRTLGPGTYRHRTGTRPLAVLVNVSSLSLSSGER